MSSISLTGFLHKVELDALMGIINPSIQTIIDIQMSLVLMKDFITLPLLSAIATLGFYWYFFVWLFIACCIYKGLVFQNNFLFLIFISKKETSNLKLLVMYLWKLI